MELALSFKLYLNKKFQAKAFNDTTIATSRCAATSSLVFKVTITNIVKNPAVQKLPLVKYLFYSKPVNYLQFDFSSVK